MLCGRLELMKWLRQIVALVFPARYTRAQLKIIPRAPNPDIRNVFACFDYHHTKGKALVYALKRTRDRILTQYVAEHMAEHVYEYLAEQQQFSYFLNPIVVPVPITKRQRQVRGFNQTEALAREFAQLIGGSYTPYLAYKHRETEKQALVKSRSQRFINVQNCFSLSREQQSDLLHKDIIIIDDLVTTGATIASLEKTLRAAGARNVIAITVAH